MHRNTLRALALVFSVVGLYALILPAANAKPGGKKPVGEIVSFDAATGTLTVDMVSGEDFSGTVADDVKVKVEHRGNHEHGKGHKKHSNGDLGDLVEGTKVLRLKLDDGEIEKIRVRPTAETTAATQACAEDEDAEDESDELEAEDDADEADDADDEDADGESDELETDDADGDDCDEADDADDADELEAEDDADEADDDADEADDDAVEEEDVDALDDVKDALDEVIPPTE